MYDPETLLCYKNLKKKNVTKETFCRKQNELKMVIGRSLDLILRLTAITDDSSG